MTAAPLPPLVTTDWLARHLGNADVRVLDASWYLPAMNRDAKAEYLGGHIPGAVFFDLDGASDPDTHLPHMLPGATPFADRMSRLGVGDEHRVIVYDGSGANLSAARVWWMLRLAGHRAAAVLDGGLGKWRVEGRPLEHGPVVCPPAVFTARFDPAGVRSLSQMKTNVVTATEQVVDTRSAGRFEGRVAEPRPGVRSGHIPGSRNVPFTDLVSSDGTLLPADALRRRLADAGVDPGRPVVATCGSGTSACALALALAVLGADRVAVYDGSWSEWGADPGAPIETGPAEPGGR